MQPEFINGYSATMRFTVRNTAHFKVKNGVDRLACARMTVMIVAIAIASGCQQLESPRAVVVEKHKEPAAWIFVPMERSCGTNCTTTEVAPMYYPDAYEVKVSIKNGGRSQQQVYWVSRGQFEAAQVGYPLDCTHPGTCSDTRASGTRELHSSHDDPAAGK